MTISVPAGSAPGGGLRSNVEMCESAAGFGWRTETSGASFLMK